MFQLTELKKTRAWQDMHREFSEKGLQEGHQKGLQEGLKEGIELAQRDVVRHCLAKGLSMKETAKLTGISLAQVRRLAKQKD